MKDLFEREQRILDDAAEHLKEMHGGAICGLAKFEELTNEYSRLLKQLRRVTKISDKITADLNTSKIDLIDKLFRMSSLVQNSPNFISYKKITGECVYINPSASVLTGYSHDELMEDYLGLLFDEETADNLRKEIPAALIEKGILNYELSIKRKDGEIRTFSACSFLVESDEQAFGSVAIDITDKKLLENKVLEALERAEKASRAKSNFLSRMSHEMRTPMNAVIGMTNLAQKAGDAEETQKYLKNVNVAANHLMSIINDMLDMSLIEDGKMELSESEFLFRDMLDKIIAAMQFKFDENNQNFCLYVDDDVPNRIISDSRRLTQIIVNMLNNACKFTPNGGNISLSVKRMEKSDNRCRLLVKVEDDGAGIPLNRQERLFDAFEQADNTISRKFGGAGLGLAISKTIINMMNGKIWVESTPGEGAKFIFTVDVGVGDSGNKENMETYASYTEDITGAFLNKHILLVDDIEINREILTTILKETGAVIECAGNGREACDKFLADPEIYDMIFMDIHMPEMNGYEATGRIREMKIPKARTVPIIAMTADVMAEDIKKCLLAGMNDHIGKPLDMDTVIEKMKRYML